jgi:hypothetical protein
MGRTVTESLEAIQELTGFSFIFIEVSGFLGRSFWAALVRGGYQGAVYYIDKWGIKS